MKSPPIIVTFVLFIVAGCFLWQLFSLLSHPYYLSGGGFRYPLLCSLILTIVWFLILIQRHFFARLLMSFTIPVIALYSYIVYNSFVRWHKLTMLQYAIEYTPVLIGTIFAAWWFFKDSKVRLFYLGKGER